MNLLLYIKILKENFNKIELFIEESIKLKF